MANIVSLVLVGALAAPAGSPPQGGREFIGAAEPGVTPPTAVTPAGVVPEVDAEALYQQGEQAYWLGDFELAVARFEAAYAASHLPALLYNVGLAYLRRYELSADPQDLQRARAVLRNYSLELEKDPSLGQAENVPKLLAQIDELLAKVKPAEPAVASTPTAVSVPMTCPDTTPAPPLVRSLRPAGAAVMGVASLALAGGVAAALAFALKGRSFHDQLVGLRGEQQAAGCGDMASATCDYLAAAERITVDNGRRANLLAGGLGGGLAAIGVAGLAVGAVLYGRDRPRTEARAGLRVTPAIGGLVLSGRF